MAKFERDARIKGRIQKDLRNLKESDRGNAIHLGMVGKILQCFYQENKQSENGLEKSLVISSEGQRMD